MTEQGNEQSMLYTEPSFCIYADGELGEAIQSADSMSEKIERSDTIGENIATEFSFVENEMPMIEEDEENSSSRFKDLKIEIGGDGDAVALDKLKNHAQYLESTGDLYGAEEHYFRATEAGPKDGEMLSQYARLVWQLHGDQARASRYFEKAAVAAPSNSDVLAARASFLWDIDESEEEGHLSDDAQADENPVLVDSFAGDYREETRPPSPPLHLAMGLGINGAGFGDSDDSTNVEDYHKRMVEENPRNPGFLRDYALFLHQTKGDLQGAEEYYARGILEDPRDAQMLYLYADIVWQLHHDKDRAAAYFERAVEASPGDSNVLGAYAKFLWETEAEEEADTNYSRRSRNWVMQIKM